MDIEKIGLLKELKIKKYDFSGVDINQLKDILVSNIGDRDSETRDDLIYPVLAHLLHDDVLSNSELDEITNLLISDEYLFYDINNSEEYSVLKRSFTLLQLSILIYKYNQKKVIQDETAQLALIRFMSYFELEEDLRGYESEVGWCHSVAHSADLFAQIAKCDFIKDEDLEKMMSSIQKKFMIKNYQFIHDEDERMVTAIENMINRDLVPEKFITSWILQFKNFEKGTIYPEAYNILLNIKRFVRTLYFRFLDNDKYKYISTTCYNVLKEIK